jgi:hypothetical protein
MAWWRFWNETQIPLSIAIGSARVTQYCVNNLAVGGYWEADVTGWPWRDLDVGAFDPNSPYFEAGKSTHYMSSEFPIWNFPVLSVPRDGAPALAPWIRASQETVSSLADWAREENKEKVMGTDCRYPAGTLMDIGALEVNRVEAPYGWNIQIAGGTVSALLTFVDGEGPLLSELRSTRLFAMAKNNETLHHYRWDPAP